MTDTITEDETETWSRAITGQEVERLLQWHASDLYVTTEDDPDLICGYIEAASDLFGDGSVTLTLTDPGGTMTLKPEQLVLVGLTGGHHGHFGMSQWWCDTCNSPYCDLA